MGFIRLPLLVLSLSFLLSPMYGWLSGCIVRAVAMLACSGTQRRGPGVVHVQKQRGMGTLLIWHDLAGGVWGFGNKMATSQSCWKDWPTHFQKSSGKAYRLEQCWYWGDSEMLLNNSFSPFLNCSRRREQRGLGRQHRRLSTHCTGQTSNPQHPAKGQVGVTLCLEF